MTISNYLQLLAIIVSLFAALSGIYIANKNIAHATRPYISVYSQFIDTTTATKYVVIKNFGKSMAKIESIKFSKPFLTINQVTQLQSLVGTTIAPSQKFMSFVENNFKEHITVTVKYSDLNGTKYSENYPLNFDATDQLFWINTNYPGADKNDSTETVAIRSAAHLIAKHLD
jgi:hypothetical protein